MAAVDGVEFKLPPLGGAETLTIGRWRRQAGERVEARERLLEAHSARFDWDIPAPGAGILEALRAAGAVIKPGDAVAIIRPDGDAPAPRVRISPLAAKWAAANAVALEHVAGSGAGGRIVRADVQAHMDVAAAPKDHTLVPLSTVQTARATHAPDALHATIVIELDLGALAAERSAMLAAWQRHERFALGDAQLLVHAAIAALIVAPELNATLAADGLSQHKRVQAAVTIDDGESQRSGIISGAERYNVVGIARRMNALAAGGSLEGSTFTVRLRPALLATDILAAGQTASLTFGAVTVRAVAAEDGTVRKHPVVHASLTYDRRAVTDAVARRYLEQLTTIMEH